MKIDIPRGIVDSNLELLIVTLNETGIDAFSLDFSPQEKYSQKIDIISRFQLALNQFYECNFDGKVRMIISDDFLFSIQHYEKYSVLIMCKIDNNIDINKIAKLTKDLKVELKKGDKELNKVIESTKVFDRKGPIPKKFEDQITNLFKKLIVEESLN